MLPKARAWAVEVIEVKTEAVGTNQRQRPRKKQECNPERAIGPDQAKDEASQSVSNGVATTRLRRRAEVFEPPKTPSQNLAWRLRVES